MKMYEYMLIYYLNNGTGRTCVTRNRKIESYKDIEELDKEIRRCSGIDQLFITDFKLIREYEDKEQMKALFN
ncbi:hypothetical protein ACR77J_07400 [Tissierella praeacuta]|uniref:hypothetical protein n=1 Tax=Tissierella praeacuta TaxID=43131 RepID=UPI003DA67600